MATQNSWFAQTDSLRHMGAGNIFAKCCEAKFGEICEMAGVFERSEVELCEISRNFLERAGISVFDAAADTKVQPGV